MKLTFSFQGYVEVDTDEITFTDNYAIIQKVHHLTPIEIERKLDKGELFITLSECLDSGYKHGNVELSDYTVETE